MTWWQALIDAGAVPAAYVPPPGAGSSASEAEGTAAADLVADAGLQAHAVPSQPPAVIPPAVSFLNGVERWCVVSYDCVAQIVNAYVPAAACRRDDTSELSSSPQRT